VLTSTRQQVFETWERLSKDMHVGMSNAIEIVTAVANEEEGREALTEILSDDRNVGIVAPDALSYLRIARDVPLPDNVENHRADAYFRNHYYTGTQISKTHHLKIPREFLYFNCAIGIISGTLDDLGAIREQIKGSGYEPVLARMPGGDEKAIGRVMVNDFRDTTFGPYKEVIFTVTAVRADAPPTSLTVDYVNGFSLQVPLDRGATMYMLKLWLDQMRPIEGGNDLLGTNKDFGSFTFQDKEPGAREFSASDKVGKWLVSGTIPFTLTPEGAEKAKEAYAVAAERAGIRVPSETFVGVPVASRPDEAFGKPASQWGYTIDWRHSVAQEVEPRQVNLRFGDSQWGRLYGGLGFTPTLAFYAPSCIGQIHQHIGDCPYVGNGTT
jgi:hypothetical protein